MNFDRTLVLVRHGRTAWNAAGRFQGQADPPLDDVGWAQAMSTAAVVAGMAPTAIISSDLRRAHQTAAVLGIACGLVPSTHCDLREIALGRWEGLDRTEAEQLFPDEYAAWLAGLDLRRGGGETRAETGARVATALAAALRRAEPGDVVVAVSHGLALQAAMTALAGARLVDLSFDGSPPHLGNGEWIVCPATTERRFSGSGWAA
jgi:glucosyl-3-phosphoglycerate phosphatase